MQSKVNTDSVYISIFGIVFLTVEKTVLLWWVFNEKLTFLKYIYNMFRCFSIILCWLKKCWNPIAANQKRELWLSTEISNCFHSTESILVTWSKQLLFSKYWLNLLISRVCLSQDLSSMLIKNWNNSGFCMLHCSKFEIYRRLLHTTVTFWLIQPRP